MLKLLSLRQQKLPRSTAKMFTPERVTHLRQQADYYQQLALTMRELSQEIAYHLSNPHHETEEP